MCKCKDCIYWRDFENRVYARISGFIGPIHRGIVELRPCKFIPSPNVQATSYVYTDEYFECSDGVLIEE